MKALSDSYDILQSIYTKRKDAYKTTFDPKSQAANVVLADLRKFCRATGSKWMGDYEKTLIQIGRNEVWERINSYVNIPDDQLAKIVETLND
jgi:hypothetical protein